MRDLTRVTLEALQRTGIYFQMRKSVLVPDQIISVKSAEHVYASEFVFDARDKRRDHALSEKLNPGFYLMAWVVSSFERISSQQALLHEKGQLVPGNVARSLSPECQVTTLNNAWHEKFMRNSFMGEGQQDVMSRVLLHQFQVKNTSGNVSSELSLRGQDHTLRGVVLMRMKERRVSQEFNETDFTNACMKAVIDGCGEKYFASENQALGQEWESLLPYNLNSHARYQGTVTGKQQLEEYFIHTWNAHQLNEGKKISEHSSAMKKS